MGTIFMNSVNSETSGIYKPLLDILYKLNL